MRKWLWILGCVSCFLSSGKATGRIIPSIQRSNSNLAEPMIAEYPLGESVQCYVDRTYTYSSIPALLRGADYVIVVNDDKITPNYQLLVTVGEEAVLYLFLDNRIGHGPLRSADDPWLDPDPVAAGMTWIPEQGFSDTGQNIGMDTDGGGGVELWCSVYAKQVSAGRHMLYQQNDITNASLRGMYAVAAGTVSLQKDLVGYWSFDESQGLFTHDSSDNLNHGFLINAPQWIDGPDGFGGALEFDSTNYVAILDNPIFDITNKITLCAWIKLDNWTQDWETIFARGNWSWRLIRNSMASQNNNSCSFHMTGLSEGWGANGTVTVTDGKWHHVAGTWDGSYAKIYFDGILDDAQPVTGSIFMDWSDLITIGCMSDIGIPQRYFNGAIDEVRIYNRALTAGEIKKLATTSPAEGCFYLPEDVNKDCVVNLKDFETMAVSWLMCSTPNDPNCPPSMMEPGNPEITIQHSYANSAAVTVPVFMYYLERYFMDVPNKTQTDMALISAIDGDTEGQAYLLNVLESYRSLSETDKMRRFDPVVVQATRYPDKIVDPLLISSRLNNYNSETALSGGSIPSAPTNLTAENESQFEPYIHQIELNWQDNSGDEEGFLIYRINKSELPNGTMELLDTVDSNITTYMDTRMQKPGENEAQLCYQVYAYKTGIFSSQGQLPGKIVSEPSPIACAYYAIGYPYEPQPDFDKDGVPDALDECIGLPGVWPVGCPDKDSDGVPDHEDYCEEEPGDFPSWYDKGPAASQAGCPIRYNLRWMGMRVLNNSWPAAGHVRSVQVKDANGQVINEVSDYLDYGEEPYLIFSFINGMSAQGAKESDTTRWCCGERITMKIPNSDWEPDEDTGMEEHPENLDNLRNYGFTVFPGVPGMFAQIDRELGLAVTVTLMERDKTVTIPADKAANEISSLFKAGGAIFGAVSGCVGTGGLGCLMSVGGAMKALIDTIFDFTKSTPPPIEVEDPDDYMGSAVWVVSRAEAQSLTSDDGGYAFYFDMPMEYSSVCWWVPCGISPYPVQMRTRLYFCLYREGIPENQIPQLCQTYQAVVPWPMIGK